MAYQDQLIATLLADQYEDEAKKRADRSYWGDTADWVSLAIVAIERAVRGVSAPNPSNDVLHDVQTWLLAVKHSIQQSHQAFRSDQDDPDGYGSATFHEVLRVLDRVIEHAQQAQI